VYGRDLYGFLEYAREKMPEGASYTIEGFAEGSVDIVRAEYYLYPRLISVESQFILARDKDKFILKSR
jgi:hypothetical protein